MFLKSNYNIASIITDKMSFNLLADLRNLALLMIILILTLFGILVMFKQAEFFRKGVFKMLRKKLTLFILLSLSLLFFLSSPSFLSAQTQEYKDYTIEKGDTLWDISKEELKDPFLWPKVWKENPEIKNPDRIYPKQKIRIPLYLLQKEAAPQPPVQTPAEMKPEKRPEIKVVKPVEKKITPIRKEYLVNKNVLISSGYISDAVHNVGTITDSPSSRTVLGKGDYAFIKTAMPTKKGDIFYIIQSAEKVKHPKSGNNLGYLIEVLGIAEVVSSDKDVKILIKDSYSEIPVGSLLDTFYEIDPTLAVDAPRKPDITGFIIATKQLHVVNGTWDIVYLDRGKKNGLEVGDLLATTIQSPHKIYNGLIQVISLRDSTSTAIVRKIYNNEIVKGDNILKAT